jgi:hypothetical protein
MGSVLTFSILTSKYNKCKPKCYKSEPKDDVLCNPLMGKMKYYRRRREINATSYITDSVDPKSTEQGQVVKLITSRKYTKTS